MSSSETANRYRPWTLRIVYVLTLIFSVQLFALGLSAPTFSEMYMDIDHPLPLLTALCLKAHLLWILLPVVGCITPIIAFLNSAYSKLTLQITSTCLAVAFLLAVVNIVAFSIPVLQMAQYVE